MPECRRNGANYGAIACKDEHFQQALAKHKLDSENWHKTWDELLPAASSPALGDEPSDFEPELPAGPIPMADHQVITFQSATHTGSIEWSKRFERYEATAAPRDWKKGKRLPPQGAYSAGTSAELKLKLREHVAGVQFADEPEKVGASVEARDARPNCQWQFPNPSRRRRRAVPTDSRKPLTVTRCWCCRNSRCSARDSRRKEMGAVGCQVGSGKEKIQ